MDTFDFSPDVLSLNEKTPFGHGLLPYFQMDPGYTNINHGAGAAPRVITQSMHHYQHRMERCPDAWFRFECEDQVNRVIDEVRSFVRVSSGPDDRGVGDLVLVRNATFAINTIFRSWPWKAGDQLLMLSEAYDAVKLAAKFLHDSAGVQVIEIPITFPITDDGLIDLVQEALQSHGSAVKLAIFSHISSVPAVILPVERLVDLCRTHGVPAVIDGAHAMGQIDLDITKLDPDFYIANGHKWMMAAKSVAFLYVKKKWRKIMHSAVTTYGYGEFDAKKEFWWTGTADYSAYFTLSTAIKFRRLLGEHRIRAYCRKLSWEAGLLMAHIWGTELLIDNPDQVGSMNNIRLPLGHPEPTDQAGFVDKLVMELFRKHNTYLITYQQDGVWYCRISAHIYNEISDYKMVADAVLNIVGGLRMKEERSEENSADVRPDQACWECVVEV